MNAKSKHDNNTLDKILSEINSFLKERQNGQYRKKPDVFYDPKGKIRVTYYFGPMDDVEVKIIARKEEWLNMLSELNFDLVPFGTIEPYLSRPRQEAKNILKKYAEEYPDDFSAEIFECVQLANSKNPLYRPGKPRKSVYGLSKTERWEIANTAIRLYIYLRRIGKQPEYSWPPYLEKFFDTYDVTQSDLDNGLQLMQDIKDVMEEFYGVEFGERFWQTFVTEGPISLSKVKNLSALSSSIKSIF